MEAEKTTPHVIVNGFRRKVEIRLEGETPSMFAIMPDGSEMRLPDDTAIQKHVHIS